MPTINKIFIEIPTWLGDAIMTTPAIENIKLLYPNATITILGSSVSTQAFKISNNITKIIIDNSKKGKNRVLNLYNLAKQIGKVDLAISFRKSFSSKFMMFFIKGKHKYSYKRYIKEDLHQVLRYNDFINISLKSKLKARDLYLDFKAFQYGKPTLGINPGATYGSAKRWYPQEFAQVAISLSSKYDIVIFGASNEIGIAKDIEDILIQQGIKNYTNLASKTSIPELISKIAGLDIFITNDSGPMHIAASFKINTYCIFGPTKYNETNQWNNKNEHIISKDLDCSPCMKRVCPIKTHACMKDISANDILKLIHE